MGSPLWGQPVDAFLPCPDLSETKESRKQSETKRISSYRNKTLPVKLIKIKWTWMDLESVIQSEVSQKEKNKYRMVTHIYGI